MKSKILLSVLMMLLLIGCSPENAQTQDNELDAEMVIETSIPTEDPTQTATITKTATPVPSATATATPTPMPSSTSTETLLPSDTATFTPEPCAEYDFEGYWVGSLRMVSHYANGQTSDTSYEVHFSLEQDGCYISGYRYYLYTNTYDYFANIELHDGWLIIPVGNGNTSDHLQIADGYLVGYYDWALSSTNPHTYFLQRQEE